jgi:hypothetical protein
MLAMRFSDVSTDLRRPQNAVCVNRKPDCARARPATHCVMCKYTRTHSNNAKAARAHTTLDEHVFPVHLSWVLRLLFTAGSSAMYLLVRSVSGT